MDPVLLFGWIATSITLLYTGLGLPSQIKKNAAAKSTDGLSGFMAVLLCATMISWVIYGTLRVDWFIVIPNSIGALCAGIILVQFWMYRESIGSSTQD